MSNLGARSALGTRLIDNPFTCSCLQPLVRRLDVCEESRNKSVVTVPLRECQTCVSCGRWRPVGSWVVSRRFAKGYNPSDSHPVMPLEHKRGRARSQPARRRATRHASSFRCSPRFRVRRCVAAGVVRPGCAADQSRHRATAAEPARDRHVYPHRSPRPRLCRDRRAVRAARHRRDSTGRCRDAVERRVAGRRADRAHSARAKRHPRRRWSRSSSTSVCSV